MLKLLPDNIWAWDAEWVPCVDTGRRVYHLDPAMPDAEVMAHMFKQAGATDENPRPYLKTALCRIVSIAAVKREARGKDTPLLDLVSLPKLGTPLNDEREIVSSFLTSAGRVKPCLVGFNSVGADLPVIVQRALVHHVSAAKFCQRPNKPWEGIDYFAKRSDAHVDLKDLVACYGYGKSTPSLNEIAAACGIPAKGEVSGASVLDLWLDGKVAEIIRYNQRDAITTYLLWLRVALLSGKVTREQFDAEENALAEMLLRLYQQDGRTDLLDFVQEWRGTLIAEATAA